MGAKKNPPLGGALPPRRERWGLRAEEPMKVAPYGQTLDGRSDEPPQSQKAIAAAPALGGLIGGIVGWMS